MSADPIRLASLSAAMDGGFVGVADVADVMRRVGASEDHRLIGGLTVMLHVQRLGLDLPLRATGDADFGVSPHLLRFGELVNEIEALGYERTAGNRWERSLDERRTAAIDLLVPAPRIISLASAARGSWCRAATAPTSRTASPHATSPRSQAPLAPSSAIDRDHDARAGQVLVTDRLFPARHPERVAVSAHPDDGLLRPRCRALGSWTPISR